MKNKLFNKILVATALLGVGGATLVGVNFAKHEHNHIAKAETVNHDVTVTALYTTLNTYDGWLRVDFDSFGYDTTCNNTTVVYSASALAGFNFRSMIYVNGKENQLLLQQDKSNYTFTYGLAGSTSSICFHESDLTCNISDIKNITLKAGTQLPSIKGAGTDADPYALSNNVYVMSKTMRVYVDGPACEVKTTSVEKMYKGGDTYEHFTYSLTDFPSGSQSQSALRNNVVFNTCSNPYINKYPDEKLFADASLNSFGPVYSISVYPKSLAVSGGNLRSKFEGVNFITLPKGTEFPDQTAFEAAKNTAAGTVYVTTDTVTYCRSGDYFLPLFSDTDNYGLMTLSDINPNDFSSGIKTITTKDGGTFYNAFNPLSGSSFGIKFVMNVASGTAFEIKANMGVADWASSSYSFKVNTSGNDGAASIQLLYGESCVAVDYNTKIYSDVDNTFELYAIPKAASKVRFVFIVNNLISLDQTYNVTSESFGRMFAMTYYFNNVGPVTVKDYADSDSEALAMFLQKALKMDENNVDSTVGSTYSNAKDYYFNCLTNKQKTLFETSSSYSTALARLQSWATANGETFSDKTFGQQATFVNINEYNNNIINESEPDHTRTYLVFDKKPSDKVENDPIGNGKVKFDGVNGYNTTGFKVWAGDNGGNFIIVDIPLSMYEDNAAYPYHVLQLEQGIGAFNIILGEVNLYLNSEDKWEPFTELHTVTINGKSMYIPHGLTLPEIATSTYCSATFTDGEGHDVDIAAPITEDLTITANFTEHDYVEHAATASTCVSHGNVQYWTCANDGCNKVFVKDGQGDYAATTIDAITLPFADHTIDPDTIDFYFAPNTNGKGYDKCGISYHCSVCYDKIDDVVVDTTSSVTKQPTCSENGETTYVAEYRGYSDSLTVADVPATGHKQESVTSVNGQTATCMVPGYKEAYLCTDCGLYYSDASLANEYLIGSEADYLLWIVGQGQVIKPHSCTVHYDAKEATCTKTGAKEYYRCTECNNYFEDADGLHIIGDLEALQEWLNGEGKVALNEHNHKEGTLTHHEAKSPTCARTGNIEYWSCECGAYLIEVEGEKVETPWNQIEIAKDPNAHKLIYVDEVPATYEAAGVKAHYECTECHKLFLREGEQYIEVTAEDLAIKQLTKGCFGSVVATSTTIAVVSILGAALLAIRKKENK